LLLLGRLGDAPEQSNGDVRKILSSKTRLDLKREDLGKVLELWMAGESDDDIFAALPTPLRSKVKPSVGDWLSGNARKQSGSEVRLVC